MHAIYCNNEVGLQDFVAFKYKFTLNGVLTYIFESFEIGSVVVLGLHSQPL